MSGEIKAQFENDGKELVIRIPVNQEPVVSKSGKSRVVASSYGNVKTDLMIDGKPLTIGLNAYVKAQ